MEKELSSLALEVKLTAGPKKAGTYSDFYLTFQVGELSKFVSTLCIFCESDQMLSYDSESDFFSLFSMNLCILYC